MQHENGFLLGISLYSFLWMFQKSVVISSIYVSGIFESIYALTCLFCISTLRHGNGRLLNPRYNISPILKIEPEKLPGAKKDKEVDNCCRISICNQKDKQLWFTQRTHYVSIPADKRHIDQVYLRSSFRIMVWYVAKGKMET